MPTTIHPHLKGGLDLDAVDEEAEAPNFDNQTAEQRAAKRRRIELIATQYLKGRAPLILSAGLKGPFEKGWNNPWSQERKDVKTDSRSKKSNVQHLKPKRGIKARGEKTTASRESSSKTAQTIWAESPENSRAAHTCLEYHTQSTTQSARVLMPATAGRDPGSTKYNSTNANEEQQSVFERPSKPPWLKRDAQESGQEENAIRPPPSPTPLRPGDSPIEQHGTPRLPTPKARVTRLNQSSPTGVKVSLLNANRRSSASASMDTPSPVRPLRATKAGESPHIPMKNECSRVAVLSGPSLVASPTPNSSTGFIYHKVPKAKGGPRKTKLTKPKPVTFESSPAGPNLKAPIVPEEVLAGPESGNKPINAGHQIRVPESDDLPLPPPNVYDVPVDDEKRDTTMTSRHSTNSTQAAMLLAQLDFHEGTFPSTEADTPQTLRAVSDIGARETNLDEPSEIAITPFHAFNAELDERETPQATMQEPPISTQDLFNAASPFCFTAAKKMAIKPSNLRFAVHVSSPSIVGAAHADNALKSPTPSAERVPLKERNFRAVSTGSERCESQTSQKPASFAGLGDLNLNASFDFTTHFMQRLDEIT